MLLCYLYRQRTTYGKIGWERRLVLVTIVELRTNGAHLRIKHEVGWFVGKGQLVVLIGSTHAESSTCSIL